MKTIKLSSFALAIALGIGAFATSCSKDDNTPTPLPPIGGYNSADEVGAADLLAYWPLNGTGVESKSNTAPTTTVGTTWEAGLKGQGANLNVGYLKYPAISALTATMDAFTISAWVNIKNNQTATPGSGTASVFFTMSRPNEWEGNINLLAETGQLRRIEEDGTVNDSIKFKGSFRSIASGGESYDNIFHLEPWMIADNLITPGKHVAVPNVVGNSWAHVVFTWSGLTHKLIIYSNGVKISNPAFEERGTNSSIVFDTPSYPVIGGFGNVDTSTDNWNKPMTGKIDEIRVWKKALSLADINSLYELEKAGR